MVSILDLYNHHSVKAMHVSCILASSILGVHSLVFSGKSFWEDCYVYTCMFANLTLCVSSLIGYYHRKNDQILAELLSFVQENPSDQLGEMSVMDSKSFVADDIHTPPQSGRV